MDLGLARDVEESFRIFQGRILDEYEAMAEEMGFHVIDATLSIEQQQRADARDRDRRAGPELEKRRAARARGRDYMATRTPLQFYNEPLAGRGSSPSCRAS